MTKWFTSRKAKTANTRIVTFSKSLYATMLEVDAEAFALAWSKLAQDFQGYGVKVILDHDNQLKFLDAVKANDQGVWVSRFASCDADTLRALTFFKNGLMAAASVEFEQAYKAALMFYKVLDQKVVPDQKSDIDSSPISLLRNRKSADF